MIEPTPAGADLSPRVITVVQAENNCDVSAVVGPSVDVQDYLGAAKTSSRAAFVIASTPGWLSRRSAEIA
jgi:hypothetical protein